MTNKCDESEASSLFFLLPFFSLYMLRGSGPLWVERHARALALVLHPNNSRTPLARLGRIMRLACPYLIQENCPSPPERTGCARAVAQDGHVRGKRRE